MPVPHRRARGAHSADRLERGEAGPRRDDVAVQSADVEVIVDDEHRIFSVIGFSFCWTGDSADASPPGRRAQKTAPLPSGPPASASQTSPPRRAAISRSERQADAAAVHGIRIQARFAAGRANSARRIRHAEARSRRRSSRGCRRRRAARRSTHRGSAPCTAAVTALSMRFAEHGGDVLRPVRRRRAPASPRPRVRCTPRSPACAALASSNDARKGSASARPVAGATAASRDASQHFVEVVPGIGHAARIDQPGRHVQTVRELVALHPQRVGHRRHGLQPIREGRRRRCGRGSRR